MDRPFSEERRLISEALSPSPSCPPIEELSLHGEGALDADASARIDEHVRGCARCQAELSLMRDFESAAPRLSERAAVRSISARLDRELFAGPPSKMPQRARRIFALPRLNLFAYALAAAMLVIAAGIGLRTIRAPGLSATRDAIVYRSGALTTLSPAAEIEEPPRELRWEPLPSAAAYSVQLMEVDRSPIWSGETPQARVELPEAVRARILPGKPFLWQVTAKDATGTIVATSDLQRFRLRAGRR